MDRSFCSNPSCDNRCARQLTTEHRERANKMGLPISMRDWCADAVVDVQIYENPL
jgi:hypothetical protein